VKTGNKCEKKVKKEELGEIKKMTNKKRIRRNRGENG
jgi:hypothetical protein